MRTAAVLPVKSFGRAKQRLGEAVGQPDRAELAAGMVGDVLAALGAVPELDDVVVVTAEPRAAEAAREAGAHVIADPVEAGQSAAAALGVAEAAQRGAGARAARAGGLPGARPARGVGAARRPPGGGGRDRARPPRHGHERAAADARRTRSRRRSAPARSRATPAAGPRRAPSCGSPTRRRSSSTWTRRATSPRCSGRCVRLPDAAPRTRALLERMAPSRSRAGVTGCRRAAARAAGDPARATTSRRCSRPPPRGSPTPGLARADVLAIAHKAVAKAEGRVVRLADVTPGPRARGARRRAREGRAARRADPVRERRSWCAPTPAA